MKQQRRSVPLGVRGSPCVFRPRQGRSWSSANSELGVRRRCQIYAVREGRAERVYGRAAAAACLWKHERLYALVLHPGLVINRLGERYR